MYIKDAYYSTKCAEAFGHAIYKTVEGGKISVTEVIKEGKKPVSYRWEDLKFVGKVNEYIETIDGDYELDYFWDDYWYSESGK